MLPPNTRNIFGCIKIILKTVYYMVIQEYKFQFEYCFHII